METSEAELIGLYAGAELRLPCTRIIIDDPILLNDDNEFEARARVDGPGLRAGSIPVVRLTGRAADSPVTIHVPASSETAEATYLLEAGTVPPPLLEPVCPL